MNLTRSIVLAVSLAQAVTTVRPADGVLRLGNLRCEYLHEPLAIETRQPRLSWILESTQRGQKQTAYRVLVASAPQLLARHQGDLWDSGKVESDQAVQVAYAGQPLTSQQRCYWQVRVWDRSGKSSAWSQPAVWTMGLLKPDDWRGEWIRFKPPAAPDAPQWIWYPEAGGPASTAAPAEPRYFVRTFDLAGPVASAEIRVACDNVYTLSINGRPAGAGSNWQTAGVYQVAADLKPGRNVIAIRGSSPSGPAGLVVKGTITLQDKTVVRLVSDRRWQVAKIASAQWLDGKLENGREAQELGPLDVQPWGLVQNLTESDCPSPWLRKTFVLEAKPERALAYVNSLGHHELYVNGQQVGAAVLNPAVSQYPVRSFYVTYDIAPLLRPGRNCVGLWLGRGWHAPAPLVRFQAEIAAGGTNITIISDNTWKCARSPYISVGPYYQHGGEIDDARLDNPDWCAADYDDRAWASATLVPAPGGRAESQLCPLDRIGERLPAVACKDLGDGRSELDFGTNLAGWLRLRLPLLAAGQRIVIRYADKIGQTYDQCDVFVSAGQPHEEFCSKFNYHGFRYAIVEGLPAKPSLDDAAALLVETGLERVGSFACSNELLNRIYRMNVWTLRCLDLGGYLVDCPHRERAGYGDGQVSAESCLMNFWMPNFYEKWLRDWRDSQDANGAMPNTAPSCLAGGGGGPAWGAALPTLAWRTYLYYDDRRFLAECYDPMRRYLDFIETRCSNDVLRAYGGVWDFIGDWVAPGRGQGSANCFWPNRVNEAFNNCYRVYLWDLLEKSAAALGREDEVARCRAKLEKIRPLIHREFYDPEKHTYGGAEDQSDQCLPLFSGVTPPAERAAVLQKLADGIRLRRHGHLDTGMLGTYFLFQYLPTVQRDDLLFTIVNQTSYPGWGYMLEQGATTMWEEWEGGNSQIHSCYTSVAGWFHNGLAGIQPDLTAPGFKRIIIRPAVVGDLAWVKADFKSIHGTIVSDWKRENGRVILDVTIPPNTTATVYVPTSDPSAVTESGWPAAAAEGVKLLRAANGYAVFAVDSGRYSFRAALPQ